MPIKCGLKLEERICDYRGEPNTDCMSCGYIIIIPYDEKLLEPERREINVSAHKEEPR